MYFLIYIDAFENISWIDILTQHNVIYVFIHMCKHIYKDTFMSA